jgi:glucan 1,3-beta-glucosidase
MRGNIYSGDSSIAAPNYSNGTKITTSRPAALVNGTGFYYTVAPPTYEEYDVSNVINVKDVTGYKVAGDGQTDDTVSLQAIINTAAGKHVLFFPHGTYILTDTLLIPPGS